jgi:hypothetical protein
MYPAGQLGAARRHDDAAVGTARRYSVRPMGWRRLLLLPLALLASLAVVLLARALAQAPDFEARWRLDSSGHLQLQSSDHPQLRPAVGRSLDAIFAPGLAPVPVDGRRAFESSRWVAGDDERFAVVRQQRSIARALQADAPCDSLSRTAPARA